MRILVTGANGYVGARLYKDLERDFEVYGTYHKTRLFAELINMDLSNYSDPISTIKVVRPNVIVHAAGIPTPKQALLDEKLAYQVNVEGTKSVVEGASQNNAPVVYISTGLADAPKEIYSTTKKEAEEIVTANKADYLILRPQLVIGQSTNRYNDRMHNRLLKNINGQVEAKYENSFKMQVTWIGQLSEVIKEAINKNMWNETILVLSEEKKTRFEIANDILGEFKVDCAPFVDKESDPSEYAFQNTEKLKELGLGVYTYQDAIAKTVKDIRAWLSGGIR